MINAKTVENLTCTCTHVVLEPIIKTYSIGFGAINNIKNNNKLEAL